ncbi:MAG: lysophospholipid acyltransferase family protein [Planctomycetota bacterium]
MLLYVLRCCAVGWTVVSYLIPSLLRRPIRSEDIHRSSRYCRQMARIMGWRVRRHGAGHEFGQPGLYVVNHLSYIDPLVLMAMAPLCFVTSTETERNRFLGSVARRGGCLFTDRRSARAAREHAGMLARELQRRPVVVFPEATSTNGERVLPFKSAFFQSAVDAACIVRPVCIRYSEVGGRPFGLRTRDRVCWYGDMRFVPHLVRLIGVKRLDIDIHLLPGMQPQAGIDRKALAHQVHRQIDRRYRSGRPAA